MATCIIQIDRMQTKFHQLHKSKVGLKLKLLF